jgi:hypothetical protein
MGESGGFIMSAKVTRLAVNLLRKAMYNALPTDVQSLFPKVNDPFATTPSADPVPNIMPGEYDDYGANAGMILVTVHSYGPTEPITRVYKHITLVVDIWVSPAQSPNVDGRRLVDIVYEYIRRTLQETNWSGDQISIQRSYETERSEVMFEPTSKIYHIANLYRVEAISQTWY